MIRAVSLQATGIDMSSQRVAARARVVFAEWTRTQRQFNKDLPYIWLDQTEWAYASKPSVVRPVAASARGL